MKTFNLTTTPRAEQLPKAIHAKNDDGEMAFTIYSNLDFEAGEIMLTSEQLKEASAILDNFDLFYNNVSQVENEKEVYDSLKGAYQYFSRFDFNWEGRSTSLGQFVLANMRGALNIID